MKNLLLCAVAVFAFGCAAVGNHVVTGKARPAVLSSGVVIYNSAPEKSEVVGLVTAEYLYNAGQGDLEKRIEELKRQAGMIGANGLVIDHLQSHSRTTATAIFVP